MKILCLSISITNPKFSVLFLSCIPLIFARQVLENDIPSRHTLNTLFRKRIRNSGEHGQTKLSIHTKTHPFDIRSNNGIHISNTNHKYHSPRRKKNIKLNFKQEFRNRTSILKRTNDFDYSYLKTERIIDSSKYLSLHSKLSASKEDLSSPNHKLNNLNFDVTPRNKFKMPVNISNRVARQMRIKVNQIIVDEDQNLTITCPTNKNQKVFWYFGDSRLKFNQTRMRRRKNGDLRIFNVKQSDSGVYFCKTNLRIDLKHMEYVRSVAVKNKEPIIIGIGETYRIPCKSTLFPVIYKSWGFSLRWYHDNVEVRSNSDASKQDYVIKNARRSDSGTWRCVSICPAVNLRQITCHTWLKVQPRKKASYLEKVKKMAKNSKDKLEEMELRDILLIILVILVFILAFIILFRTARRKHRKKHKKEKIPPWFDLGKTSDPMNLGFTTATSSKPISQPMKNNHIDKKETENKENEDKDHDKKDVVAKSHGSKLPENKDKENKLSKRDKKHKENKKDKEHKDKKKKNRKKEKKKKEDKKSDKTTDISKPQTSKPQETTSEISKTEASILTPKNPNTKTEVNTKDVSNKGQDSKNIDMKGDATSNGKTQNKEKKRKFFKSFKKDKSQQVSSTTIAAKEAVSTQSMVRSRKKKTSEEEQEDLRKRVLIEELKERLRIREEYKKRYSPYI